jgi:transcriptional regulator with XRE-family HTH domain
MAAVFNDFEKWHGSSTRTPKDDGAGIGETLRVARERRGLTLEQVARVTRIPLKHLDALEHDNLAALPDPFYQRAEIRAYARALNLDPNLVLAPLERGSTPTVFPAKSAALPGAHKPDRSRHHVGFIAVGVVLTALALWRAMPRSALLDGSTQVGRDAGSTAPAMHTPDDLVTHVAVGIHRTEFDQTAQSPASTDRVAPIGIEATESRPAAEAQGDAPMIVKPADERTPAGAATELVVATEPEGARVTVDGIGWGVTPVTIRHLSPGSKRIRVSKDGYATTERVVSVVDGQRKTTDIPLSTEP